MCASSTDGQEIAVMQMTVRAGCYTRGGRLFRSHYSISDHHLLLMSGRAGKAKTTDEETEELRRFREQWRAEVKSRKQESKAKAAEDGTMFTVIEKRPLQDVHAPSLQGKTPLGYAPIPASPEVHAQLAEPSIKPGPREDTRFTAKQVISATITMIY
jgi:hypothetical protein